MTLLGTVVCDRSPSFAVIEDPVKKQQDLFRIGDIIQEGQVESIARNRMVVLRNSQHYVFHLSPENDSAISTPQSHAADVEKNTDSLQLNDILRSVSGNECLLNTLASYRTRRQLNHLLGSITLKGHRDVHGNQGIRISGLSNSRLARCIGILDGDVIRSLNGCPVPNMRKAAQVMKKARLLGHGNLDILRGNENKTLAIQHSGW